MKTIIFQTQRGKAINIPAKDLPKADDPDGKATYGKFKAQNLSLELTAVEEMLTNNLYHFPSEYIVDCVPGVLNNCVRPKMDAETYQVTYEVDVEALKLAWLSANCPSVLEEPLAIPTE